MDRTLRLIQATAEDLPRLADFYRHVIDHTPGMDVHCRWVYGLHPSDQLIEDYINQGAMLMLMEGDALVAVAAVTDCQDESYHPFAWGAPLADDQVSVIHILGIDPARSGTGLAQQFMGLIADRSRARGKGAVRLDTLLSNGPAQRFYERLGYVLRGEANWPTNKLGNVDFLLYEYLL